MPFKSNKLELASTSAAKSRSKYSALIADRDSMSSQLLADVLSQTRDYEATAVTPCDLLRSLENHEVGLVVVSSDSRSKPGNDFDLACAIAKVHPKTAIVVLLDQPSRAAVLGAFRAGARGVFSRHQPMAELLECIKHVCEGFIWAGRAESTFLLEAFKSIPAPIFSVASGVQPLTMRELQVSRKAAEGKTNKAIAAELRLSEHTVKNYLFRTFEKLGVSSRIELLFYLTVQGHTFGETKVDPQLES